MVMTSRKKRKFKNGYILWNILAFSLMVVAIIGLYIVLDIRVQQGFWVADPFIMLLDHIFYALLTALFITWLLGNLIARTRKKK